MKKCIYLEVNKRAQTFNLSSALLFSLCLLAFASPARGQNILPEPRRTPLLNGLNVLYYQQPSSPNVLLKLRIQSGASFDLAGKEGTLALLGDALFPDEATREYFTNELGGRLEVETTYDSLTVTLEGKASEYERIVESLRNALLNTPLSAEAVNRLRDSRIKAWRDANQSQGSEPQMQRSFADRFVLNRLFGQYPYGRPVYGTPESLARIERGDLMLARERFLNSDNATLVVAGNVDYNRTMRALRQLLGAWRKGDRTYPPTFRQPEPPDTRTLLIDLPSGEGKTEVRLALRGIARSDPEAAVAKLLAAIVRERWQKSSDAKPSDSFSVTHEAYALGGVLMMRATVSDAAAAKRAVDAARSVLKALTTASVSAADLAQGKINATAASGTTIANDLNSLALRWLDAETYKTTSANEARSVESLTSGDVQRIAAKLFRDENIVTVVAGNAQQLRAALPEAVQQSNISTAPTTPRTAATPTPQRRP